MPPCEWTPNNNPSSHEHIGANFPGWVGMIIFFNTPPILVDGLMFIVVCQGGQCMFSISFPGNSVLSCHGTNFNRKLIIKLTYQHSLFMFM